MKFDVVKFVKSLFEPVDENDTTEKGNPTFSEHLASVIIGAFGIILILIALSALVAVGFVNSLLIILFLIISWFVGRIVLRLIP